MIALKLPDNMPKRLENLINIWLKKPCPVEVFKDVVIDQLVYLESNLCEIKGDLVDYYMFTDPFDDDELLECASVLEPIIEKVRKRITIS